MIALYKTIYGFITINKCPINISLTNQVDHVIDMFKRHLSSAVKLMLNSAEPIIHFTRSKIRFSPIEDKLPPLNQSNVISFLCTCSNVYLDRTRRTLQSRVN